MLPTVVRFWEKEGLGPRGGTKDVVAFALFEESEDNGDLVKAWMERVARVYSVSTVVLDKQRTWLTILQARGLGRHTVGNAGSYEGGLVPVQFETVRKTLRKSMRRRFFRPLYLTLDFSELDVCLATGAPTYCHIHHCASIRLFLTQVPCLTCYPHGPEAYLEIRGPARF
jgi:hypothetical protein